MSSSNSAAVNETTLYAQVTVPLGGYASSAQAAAGTTASTSTTPYGFATSTQANAIITLVNAMRTALVSTGIIKGSA